MPEPGPPLKVLIVDDHDIVRLGVRHLLGEPTQVHEAANLADARALLAREPFRLLILDLGLGDEFSLTVLPQIRRDHPELKIIVLTSMAEELYAERALRAGADGYVMKTELAQTLAAAVTAVLAGDVHVSPRLRSTLLRRVAGGPAAAAAGPELSPREIEVLRLVGQGRSTREIAELLNRSVKTIETHKQALKDKLGAESPAMLIKIALAWCGDAS
ncbi:MAG: response regulator transcription factor [Burkholderiales bacterium]|nr:response regulator transcription factor [Burkholderiales bacterium]